MTSEDEFQAAVLNRINEPLSIETVEMRTLSPGDVLVRVHASGLCHTDLEVIRASSPIRYDHSRS